jgi:hypothetical protein
VIHLEPFLDGALASLRANLPARLAALSTSSVPLDPPADDGGPLGSPGLDYYAGVVRKPLRYPLVEVAAPDWTMTDFDLGQLTGDFDFPMMASATLRIVDPAALHSDRMYRSQMRYAAAILNVLLEPGAFGDGATVVSARGAYRQNPETRETEEIVGGVVIAFGIETTDSRDP